MRDDTRAAAVSALRMGMQLSKQGRYARRLPAPESVPHLQEAKRLLLDALKTEPCGTEVLSMLSQVEECFLNYPQALLYLEKALQNGYPRDIRQLKRLASLRQSANEWQKLRLSAEQLKSLELHLSHLGVGPQSQSLGLTREWLHINQISDAEGVVAALEERGAFTDFQVLENVCRG